ncbi:transporter substrate-binding domain-containing protein [Duganella sp. FT92W]|uniref:Transporter substrate-binding domain-containing protein n=1 Tax=Pseudoduganella rivuli TaxID=2666085 RepID=A0A7X2LVS5_9BURK|nr:transporter substrate-binding domain-containing protein [Pseudoduganella rivuli]MRV74387.1 transporter substrate-binding domain-containing protein [Pseudoduganella rivuli]
MTSRPTRLLAALCTACFLLLAGSCAVAGEIALTAINTYRYPPFLYPDGSGLCDILVRHLNQQLKGRYKFELQHLPRMRLLRAHLDAPLHFDAVGLMLAPNFIDDDGRSRYLWSTPIFEDYNVLVFAGATPPPVRLLSDLKGKRYGTIRGYRYMGLETMIADGVIQLDLTNDEHSNLRKLLAGRIDFTQMNRFMYRNVASEAEFAGKLSYVRTPGPNSFARHVFVARDRPELMAAINEALATLPCNPDWQAMAHKTDIVVPACAR